MISTLQNGSQQSLQTRSKNTSRREERPVSYIDSKISDSCFLTWSKEVDKKASCEREIEGRKALFYIKSGLISPRISCE